MGEVRQRVACRVAAREYAFPIERVREIIRDAEPVRVGHDRGAMLGVVDLRGTAMPVLDLAAVIDPDARSSGTDQSRRVVVTMLGDEVIGWLVDGVDEVLGVDAGDIEQLERSASPHVRHVARTSDGRLVPILEVHELARAAA